MEKKNSSSGSVHLWSCKLKITFRRKCWASGLCGITSTHSNHASVLLSPTSCGWGSSTQAECALRCRGPVLQSPAKSQTGKSSSWLSSQNLLESLKFPVSSQTVSVCWKRNIFKVMVVGWFSCFRELNGYYWLLFMQLWGLLESLARFQ